MATSKPSRADWNLSGFVDPTDVARWHVAHAPDEHDTQDHERNWTRARQRLFVNQSWRLTRYGMRTLQSFYISYSCASPDNKIMTGRLLLGLDEGFNSPWHVQEQKLTVFDQMLFFELQMCNGSAQQWLSFKFNR